MRNARTILTKREASDFIVFYYLLKHPVEAFRRKKEKIQRKRIPLPDPTRWFNVPFWLPIN